MFKNRLKNTTKGQTKARHEEANHTIANIYLLPLGLHTLWQIKFWTKYNIKNRSIGMYIIE